MQIFSENGWETKDGHFWTRAKMVICDQCEGRKYIEIKRFVFFKKKVLCPKCGGVGQIRKSGE